MAKSKSSGKSVFRINNMRGLMNTVVEENAFNTFDPNAKYGIGFETVNFEFPLIQNFKPTNRGGLSKTHGYSVYCDTASAVNITGIYEYIRSNGTTKFLISYGTAVYDWDGSNLTTIGMTVDNGAFLDFETAYDKLIVADGVNQLQTYDGTTVANLATGADGTATAGARAAIFHQNRLFTFSTSHDQSLVYYSDPGLINSGYSTNFVQCDVNDGQKITAIARYFIPGDLQAVIMVGKERSIGMIIGDGTDTNPYTFVKVAEDVGVPGFRQLVQFEDDLAYLTKQGIASYKASLRSEAIKSRMLTNRVANQFDTLSATTLPNALGWLDWKNRRFSYAVASGNSTYPDRVWHYDLDLQGFYLQTGFSVTAAYLGQDGTVYTGTTDGKVLEHSSTNTSYAGASINGIIKTPYLDFFEPHYYKRIADARVVLRSNGAYSLGISSMINNGINQGTSHTIPMNAGAYTWGMGTWNNTGVYQWGASPLLRNKFFPGTLFENIAFTITQSGADEPVDFLEMILEVEKLNLI